MWLSLLHVYRLGYTQYTNTAVTLPLIVMIALLITGDFFQSTRKAAVKQLFSIHMMLVPHTVLADFFYAL